MTVVAYFGMVVPAVVKGDKPEGQHLPSKKTLAKRAAKRNRGRAVGG